MADRFSILISSGSDRKLIRTFQSLCIKIAYLQGCITKLQFIDIVLFLPKDKTLAESKLKAFANDKINKTENVKFVIGRIANIVGKGENCGYQHFLHFPECFHKGRKKSGLCHKKLTINRTTF